jgi:hypothetical protein
MLVTSSDVASIDALLGRWENVEYAAEVFVILGCVGEFISEFTKIRSEQWRHQLSKRSLLVLTTALALELGALVRTNVLSGQEIALLNTVAADARARAANAEGTAKGYDAKISEAQRGTAEAQRDAGVAAQKASEANERASKNEKEAATLRKRAEDEASARVKIEARVTWRRLTEKQKTDIGLLLGRRYSNQAVNFWFSAGDTEASWFAADIADAVQQSEKLHVYPPASLIGFLSGKLDEPIRRVETGVRIFSSPRFPQTQLLADSLSRELNNCGFDAVSKVDPAMDRQPEIQVFVDPRPEGPQGEFKLAQSRAAAKRK